LVTLARDLVDLVWPDVCAACAADATGSLCDACEDDLRQLGEASYCRKCGRSMDGPACEACDGQGSPTIRSVWRVGSFEPPLSTLIRAAKFGGRWELCRPLGERLAGVVDVPVDAVIVPVPLHPHRRARRGFDQAELIAKSLARQIDRPLVKALVRRRNTRPQTELQGIAARQTNLRDAFVMSPQADVAGRPVILVDDVTTSGSTIRSAARAVAVGNPTSVVAAVLAVAERPEHRFQH
ncbi:MAG: ComF family protein, partial [Planctomycetota bacterium]